MSAPSVQWVSNAPKLDFSDGPYTVKHAPIGMWPDREELNRRMVLSHHVVNARGDALIESSESCCNEIAEAWNLNYAEWLMLRED